LPRYGGAPRPALIPLLAKKFFRTVLQKAGGDRPPLQGQARMSWTGQIFWLLASEGVESFQLSVERKKEAVQPLSTLNSQLSTSSAFSPPSPPVCAGDWPMGSRIQLQQRNCSRFARDFLRRSTRIKLAKNVLVGGTRAVVSSHTRALTAQRPPSAVLACA
jgi:hypothetical protein